MTDEEKEKKFEELMNKFPTHVSLDYHDRSLEDPNSEISKHFQEMFGKVPAYQGIIINWSEKGRGFGEYVFYQENGKIYCLNECDSKETVKRILCQMVDQAEFIDN